MNPAHWAGFGLNNPASQPARPTMARAAAWLATRFHTAMGPAFAARPTYPALGQHGHNSTWARPGRHMTCHAKKNTWGTTGSALIGSSSAGNVFQ
jgi:hypothetical protein